MSDPIIHITWQVCYRYKGWLFEYHRNKPFGPWPLRKDFEPRQKAGKVFYDMFEEFNDLSEAHQEMFRV